MFIKLNDQQLEVVSTLGSFKRFKTLTGKSLLDEKSFENIDEDTIGALIWAFTRSDMDLEYLEESIQISDIPTITETIVKTIEDSLPKVKTISKKKK